MPRPYWIALFVIFALVTAAAAMGCERAAPRGSVVTLTSSAVGDEAELLFSQLSRFHEQDPGVRVEVRTTPDSADERRQLYVQWLNAHAEDPDVLQIDVTWTAEFAAAGWIRPLDEHVPDAGLRYFASTVRANTWRGRLYAVPWFVDVGMLYWRTDIVDHAPATFEELKRGARSAIRSGRVDHGLVWQGARYEGLVTVFLEYLGGFGGRILDDEGRVVVDDEHGVRALEEMTAAIGDIVSPAVLSWHEEESRHAFQSGRAAFMRNWPYAQRLMQREGRSQVAGRFAVAPMPGSAEGMPSATLGGAQLAISAFSDLPEAAWAVVEFLTHPLQALQRAGSLGQYPPHRPLYDDPRLMRVLGADPVRVRAVIDAAVPRPVTPVYGELSEVLQIHLHRALSGQQAPRAALSDAARRMRDVIERAGLADR